MDQTTESQLSAILAKGPTGLTEADAAFLRARRDYLTADQQITYAAALDAAPAPAPEPALEDTADQTADSPKKKAK
ncbi:MAG TPA: hypothetical protein VLC46_26835 [Thermoanaerobaculia bacterium]|jgi:hypothetical protein|nr:hypothetical protein [Thermoanaerobaculia bacterium]